MASRGMRPAVEWSRIALYVAVAAGLAVTVLPALGTNAWWVRMLDFPRVQFLVALALLLALLFALPGRFRPASLTASLVVLGCILWQAAVLFPYSPIPPPRLLATEPACQAGHRLRVLAANVQMTNENAERLFAMIRESDPDVILLQETDAWWDQRLVALHDAWPHAVQEVNQNYFGIHLLSRYPLVDPEVVHLTSSRNPAIFTGVALPVGQVVRFHGVHPRPPLPGQSSAERDGQLLGAALAMHGQQAPVVMAGDFNAVPWEDVMQRLERVGGLLPPRIGRGWLPTYRTGSFFVTWPLDHILAGPRFTLGRFETLGDFGSDHYPVLADLCFAPDAAVLQQARALEPGDLAAARQAVAAAQNRAVPSPEPAQGKQQPQPG